MKARDVMTTDVIAVHPDTPAQEIAKLLLAKGISAVPVVDGKGEAIGLVSEGDLIGRHEPNREARREWWLSLLAEGEALNPEFVASLRPPGHKAKDVMSAPVVTVTEETDTHEVAQLLQSYRIKRVPVLRHGQLVGIVSRADLLRAFAAEEPQHPSVPTSGSFARAIARLDEGFRHHNHNRTAAAPTRAFAPGEERLAATDFRRLVADFQQREVLERQEAGRAAVQERRKKVAEMIDKHISDENWRGLLHRARAAAEDGEKEFMLLRFPSQLCSDDGRAINVGAADWPMTLRGEAAEIYLRWEQDLKSQGFHLGAHVLEFPGGIPGDIGLFLIWGQ